MACVRIDIEWLSGIIRHLVGEEGKGEEYRGLMVLRGYLREFHLPDLIKLIVSGRHSGTLTVSDQDITRTITFEEGRPACATCVLGGDELRDPQQIKDGTHFLFRWQEGEFVFDQRLAAQEGCLVLSLAPTI